MRTRRGGGVTTIEIVLIVAIICLLVAIAFPWFTRAGRQQGTYEKRYSCRFRGVIAQVLGEPPPQCDPAN